MCDLEMIYRDNQGRKRCCGLSKLLVRLLGFQLGLEGWPAHWVCLQQRAKGLSSRTSKWTQRPSSSWKSRLESPRGLHIPWVLRPTHGSGDAMVILFPQRKTWSKRVVAGRSEQPRWDHLPPLQNSTPQPCYYVLHFLSNGPRDL